MFILKERMAVSRTYKDYSDQGNEIGQLRQIETKASYYTF